MLPRQQPQRTGRGLDHQHLAALVARHDGPADAESLRDDGVGRPHRPAVLEDRAVAAGGDLVAEVRSGLNRASGVDPRDRRVVEGGLQRDLPAHPRPDQEGDAALRMRVVDPAVDGQYFRGAEGRRDDARPDGEREERKKIATPMTRAGSAWRARTNVEPNAAPMITAVVTGLWSATILSCAVWRANRSSPNVSPTIVLFTTFPNGISAGATPRRSPRSRRLEPKGARPAGAPPRRTR